MPGRFPSRWGWPLVLAALATFGWLTLALAVATRPDPGDRELQLFHMLFDWRHDALTSAMVQLDRIVVPVVAATLLLFVVASAANRNWASLCLLVAVALGGNVAAELIKGLVARGRPQVDALVSINGPSFPSAQVLAVTLLAGWAIHSACAASMTKVSRHLVSAGASIIVLVIAYSRIYLGAHYPADVAAGVLIGTSWLCLCVAALPAVEERARQLVNHNKNLTD